MGSSVCRCPLEDERPGAEGTGAFWRAADRCAGRFAGAGGELSGAAPIGDMDPLDLLATDLRERLLAGAGDDASEDLASRIRALVDAEAGVLSEDRRGELAARIARKAFGLGPLEALLEDEAVDEIMVSGTRPVWVERGG